MFEKFILKCGKVAANPAQLMEMAPLLFVMGLACAVADVVENSKKKKK